MTNQPADAARPDQGPDQPGDATEPAFAPPAPPPGPLWPSSDAGAPSDGAASAGGWPPVEASGDGVPTPPSAPGLDLNDASPDRPATSVPATDAEHGAAPGDPETPPAAAPTSGPAGAPTSGPADAGTSGGPQETGSGGFASNLGAQFTPGFMARYGLIRPVTGRYFAGVCAAVGRATNTDPVLWRVLFAVLTLFGGVGLLAYLIGWLLIPADGDTASPVEAVLGRGVSRTSAPVAVIGTVVAILVFALVASEGLRPAVVGALVVLGAAVLLSRGTLQRPGQVNQNSHPFGPPPMVPPGPHQPASGVFGAPAHGAFGAPAHGAYGAQVHGAYGAPTHGAQVHGAYGAPTHGAYGAPTHGAYGAPTHGAYGAPTHGAYGAPTHGAPVHGAHGAHAQGPHGAQAFGVPATGASGTSGPGTSGPGTSGPGTSGPGTPAPGTPGAIGSPATAGPPGAFAQPGPGTPAAFGRTGPATPATPGHLAAPTSGVPGAAGTPGQPGSQPTTPTPVSGAAPVPTPVASSDPRPPSEPTVQKSPLAEPEEMPADTESATVADPDRQETEEVVPAQAHVVTDESPTVPQPAAPARPQDLSYGQPFAPHGPFAPPGPYPPAFGPVPQTQTRRLPLYGPYPPIPGAGLPWDAPVSVDPMSHYPGMQYSGPPASQPKAKVKRPKSRLGRVTLYATAVALGTLATVHLLGASIAGSAYFAVALAVVGLGLVAGAWVGRARLLIPLGFVLSLGLLISTASAIDGPHRGGRPELLNPTTITEINAENPFTRDTGDITIDFTQIDFEGQNVTFEASNDVGQIRVILPPNVDVTVRAKVEVGDARVFNSSWGGLSDRWRTVVDHGEDGPDKGGNLQLTLSVDVGNLEVYR